MKTMRNLFLLCAGLSLFACSSDDDATQQFPEGTGTILVRIEAPVVARSIAEATTDTDTDNKITLTGTYKVKLEALSGGKTIDFTPSDQNKVAKFEGVTGPQKVIVTLNDGVADYSNASIDTLNVKNNSHITADKVPAYGETATFTEQSTIIDAEGKVTKTFGATVQMAIPVARLEIGTISLDDGADDFSKLLVGGVYLDKLRSKGSKYNNGVFEETATANDTTDYQFGDTENQYGNGDKYVLGDISSTDLCTDNAVIPESGKVYAYNFFGATPSENPTQAAVNPQFKIYFSQTKLSGESESAPKLPRYAMITKYNDKSGQPIVLQNGKIYQIKDVKLKDKNIVGDEENKAVEYQVEVTVTEAVWEIIETSAEWAGDEEE